MAEQVETTFCRECYVPAVAFNELNVTVQCHACGAEEKDIDVRQAHLEQWLQKRYDYTETATK